MGLLCIVLRTRFSLGLERYDVCYESVVCFAIYTNFESCLTAIASRHVLMGKFGRFCAVCFMVYNAVVNQKKIKTSCRDMEVKPK